MNFMGRRMSNPSMTDQELWVALEIVRKVDYNPETGQFLRKPSGVSVSTAALQKGYAFVPVDGKKYPAHRLAVLFMTGKWPDGEVDHINGQRNDNRWCNLRVVDHAINQQNRRAANTNNRSTGTLGTYRLSGDDKVQAKIHANGRRHWLGAFDTVEAAQKAYLVAKRKLHPGCTI